MAVTIRGIAPDSPASRKEIRPGDVLESINGHPIRDVLDYRFYMTDTRLALALRRYGPQGGVRRPGAGV